MNQWFNCESHAPSSHHGSYQSMVFDFLLHFYFINFVFSSYSSSSVSTTLHKHMSISISISLSLYRYRSIHCSYSRHLERKYSNELVFWLRSSIGEKKLAGIHILTLFPFALHVCNSFCCALFSLSLFLFLVFVHTFKRILERTKISGALFYSRLWFVTFSTLCVFWNPTFLPIYIYIYILFSQKTKNSIQHLLAFCVFNFSIFCFCQFCVFNIYTTHVHRNFFSL